MKKALISAIFLCLVILSCDDNDNRYSIELDDFCGVWANEHCEMVKTGKYEILFERVGDHLYSSIRLINHEDKKLKLATLAAVKFDPENQQVSVKAFDLVNGDTLFIDADPDGTLNIINHYCEIKTYPEKMVITSEGKTIGELAKSTRQLRLQFPSGNWHELEQVEELDISDSYMPVKASDDNIGVALHQWRLGTTYKKNNQGFANAIEIHTNKHSFVFNVDQREDRVLAYCRAARVRSNNNGTLFAQNIRLINYSNFTAYMVNDNFETTLKDLVIQDSLFDPNICVYAEDGIYWSLKDFNDSTIIVNGCGEDYTYNRPGKNSVNILEWFEYVDY